MKLYLTSLLLIALLSVSSTLYGENGKRRLSASEKDAVVQAIQDEIYDYGYYGDYDQFGQNLGTPQHWKSKMLVYIDPEYDPSTGGRVIYKLLPYGEILRFFDIDNKGQVQLDGDPTNGFPRTQPSTRTIFLDDDDVCNMKRRWVEDFFVVDVAPSNDILRGSAIRQKSRTGYSYWEDKNEGRGSPAKKK